MVPEMEQEEYRRRVAGRFSQVMGELRRESDRGSVIVAALILEDELGEALVARFVAPAERDDELLRGAYAPLSTLAAKIDVAYRVGLVRPVLRRSLHVIRKLRNEFAHEARLASFQDSEIQNRVITLCQINRSLIEQMWDAIVRSGHPYLQRVIGPREPDARPHELAERTGWRLTFELLAALLIGVVFQIPSQTERLSGPESSTTQEAST